jgi:UDP-N-acetylglucosamine--N-acetylmuramyl-(pentapeptide) pyrophosphoryl-undecaprenol N-acetylglucosamine transferase
VSAVAARAESENVRQSAEASGEMTRIDVVIAGGGTGGHTGPGLAVAALLSERALGCAWIGSRGGLEAARAPEAGLTYFAIPTGKLRRYWAWQNVADLAVNVPAGVLAAWRLLRRLRPRVVFATGGFVALPVVLAAAAARVPIVVHEQTLVPGLANRIAARFARRVAVTFPDSAGCFAGAEVVVTGNPLRPELRRGASAGAAARFGLDPAVPLVYVTGGAQGAQRINRAVGAALRPLLEQAQVIHQSGDNPATGDRDWLEARRGELPEGLRHRYTVVPWVGAELADIYAAAALVVSRAGAGTVNECCQLGLPALYIPLPETRGDEQAANARLVERAGGAVVLPQAELTPDRLAAEVKALLADPRRLKEMGERARRLAVPDAAERLVALLVECS